jgi:hypothetical protein
MSNAAVKVRSLVLPTEHGGWGFLFEPILLGLLVAFSWAGVALSAAAICVFLVQQPLKIALRDRLRGKHYPPCMCACACVARVMKRRTWKARCSCTA